MQFTSLAKSLALGATLLAALAAPVAAQVKEHTFKVGIGLIDDHPQAQAVRHFAERLQAKGGGKMNAKLFASGSLGNDVSMTSALRGGTLEMTVPDSSTLMSLIKPFGVLNLPLTFNNEAEADALLDGPFGQKLHARLEEKGIVALGYWELGFRNLTNNVRPINKVEDIAGLKLRVIPNPINLDWVQALGANPVALAFPEVFNALEQRAVDGQENPVTVILANKFAEVQKHLALTRHQYNPQSMIISKKVWDTFSADEKKVFQDAAKEAIAHQRKVSREQSETALEALKKAGMQVTELPPEEVAKLREKMKPVIEKHSATVGADVVTELQAELAKLRTK